MGPAATEILLPPDRLGRWLENFTARHGRTGLRLSEGALLGAAEDGSAFRAVAPFDRPFHTTEPTALAAACDPPALWGLLLVRKGGFAVARLEGRRMTAHKAGRRHVQGRTKAGGQSQQRFARRRENQARDAYRAAADHAARVLSGVTTVVTGGDAPALRRVLADPRLAALEPTGHRLPVSRPRGGVLEGAVADACCVRMRVTNADQESS